MQVRFLPGGPVARARLRSRRSSRRSSRPFRARTSHVNSPELTRQLSAAFENHQAVMLQTPWPEQMLQSFEATRRLFESAAQAPGATPARDE